MAVATKTAPKTAEVSQTIITREVRKPEERPIKPPEPEEKTSYKTNFWEYLGELTEADWKDHRATLYRFPLGQTKPRELGRYIETFKADNPLRTLDQIEEKWGGGQYDLLLQKRNERGTMSTVRRESFDIDGPAKNPWGPPAGAVPPAQNTELSAVLQTVLATLERIKSGTADDAKIKESIALVRDLGTAIPRNESVKDLVAALVSMKELAGFGNQQNNIIDTIRVLKELGILGGEEQKRRSIAEEIKEVLEVAALVGGGGVSRPPGVLSQIIDHAPTILEKGVLPIVDRVATISSNNVRLASMRAGGPAISPAAPVPPIPAAAAPGATAAAAPPRVVAPPETEPATPAAMGEIQITAPNIEWAKVRIVQLFLAGKTGDSVAEFLDNLDPELGNQLGSLSIEHLRGFIKGDPILSQIAGAPRLEEFLSEFMEYFSEEDQVEGASAASPAA